MNWPVQLAEALCAKALGASLTSPSCQMASRDHEVVCARTKNRTFQRDLFHQRVLPPLPNPACFRAKVNAQLEGLCLGRQIRLSEGPPPTRHVCMEGGSNMQFTGLRQLHCCPVDR